MTTLEKVKRLERYVAGSNTAVDPVLDSTINKLLEREAARLLALKAHLVEQLVEFEQRYSLASSDFYERYERGELGDAMDFVEWAATVEMVEHVEQQVRLLQTETAS